MNVTELLVTGFDGEKAVFAASLTPDRAATVMTSTDASGQTTIEAAGEQATPAFHSICRLVEDWWSGPALAGRYPAELDSAFDAGFHHELPDPAVDGA